VCVYAETFGLTGGWLVFASDFFPVFLLLLVSGLLSRRRRLRSLHGGQSLRDEG